MSRVFVLGAGASKDANAPLTVEIVPFLLKQHPDLNEEPLRISTVTLSILIRQLKKIKTNDYLRDLDVEELLSLTYAPIYLKSILGWNDSEIDDFKNHLQWGMLFAINDGLDTCKNFDPYKMFGKIVKEDDAIISFNYDLLFESIIMKKFQKINYYLDRKLLLESGKIDNFLEGNFTFLKLHGSMNLYYCDKCNKFSLHDPPIAILTEDPNMGSLGNHFFTCPDDDGGNLISVIVPPGAEKSKISPILMPAWEKAFDLLKTAEEIIIIGISFRDHDIYLKHLICGSLSKNNDVKITYIGNDLTSKKEERLTKLFNNLSIEFIDGGYAKWITSKSRMIRFY